MYINKIGIMPLQNYNLKTSNNNSKNNITNPQITSYNPVAYRDYNISFGDRLFRTPENFYEQQFNRENMPQTMKAYLFENYESRSHIPPAQMMKIVFNDINNAKSLDEVKELFPNEPLFANLHESNKKHREGILAEINLMHEKDKSLFKNGKDDLGLYILKKIYIEGKTLKEINKDFKKDVSVFYDGISDINYRDIANMGIKFPNQSFWHSFYVTREDFPYVSVSKKDSTYHASQKGKKELTLADINSGNFEDKRPPKYKPKDHEVKNIKDALLEDFGDIEKTRKNLKHRLRADDPKLTFIQQYMGEIMSISLDRVHASDEMRAFFEDYENIDKSARSRMKKYWDATPEMKALQGLVMSDTIKLFFETYGADGKNEVFEDLIKYAHSIKPNRQQAQIKHNEKQLEYEEIFKDYDPDKSHIDESEAEEFSKLEREIKGLSQDIKKLSEYYDKHKYTYQIGNHSVNMQDSIDNMISEYNRVKMDDYLPVAYINKYSDYMKHHPKSNNRFLLSVMLYDTKNNATDEIFNELYPSQEAADMLYEMQIDFMRDNLAETRAAHQAMVTTMVTIVKGNENIDDLTLLYNMYPLQVANLKDSINVNMEGAKPQLSKYYNLYRKPLQTGETQKITTGIAELLRKYDASKSHLKESSDGSPKEIQNMIQASNIMKQSKSQAQKFLKDCIYFTLTNGYGGSARAILDKDLPESIRVALMEDIVLSMIGKHPKEFSRILMFSQMNM